MKNNHYQLHGRRPHAASCIGCGTPILTMATRKIGMACSLRCRVEAGVERRGPEECWPWVHFVEPDGYGRFTFDGVRMRSHRAAYELAKGPIPEGLVVMHACDNPLCCNPAHLSAGTVKDNTQDMIAKGRNRPPRGEKSTHAKLTDDAVRHIRSSKENAPTMAKLYGVNEQCIYKVRQRIRWKHVPDHA